MASEENLESISFLYGLDHEQGQPWSFIICACSHNEKTIAQALKNGEQKMIVQNQHRAVLFAVGYLVAGRQVDDKSAWTNGTDGKLMSFASYRA